MTDPRFPDRPSDDPDFWLISQALIDGDKVADAGEQTFEDIAGRIVDPKTLAYIGEQRALQALGQRAPQRFFTLVVASWIDGFHAGARFQHMKTSGAQQFGVADQASATDPDA